jgi:hypothetical protein
VFSRIETALLLNSLSISSTLWRQGITDARVPHDLVEMNMWQLDAIHDIVRKLGGDPTRPSFGAEDFL